MKCRIVNDSWAEFPNSCYLSIFKNGEWINCNRKKGHKGMHHHHISQTCFGCWTDKEQKLWDKAYGGTK